MVVFREKPKKISVIFSVFPLSKAAQQKPQLNLSSSAPFFSFLLVVSSLQLSVFKILWQPWSAVTVIKLSSCFLQC